jgi:hypothetical protein
MLIFSSDKMAQANELKDICMLRAEDIIRKFRENGISLEALLKTNEKLSEKERQLCVDEALKDESLRKQWMELLNFTSKLFRKHDIVCVFIKILNSPWSTMTDLDVLPLNVLEEIKALEILSESGFKLFQFRLLAHPLKIMAARILQDGKLSVAIDFYPKPMWIRKKVCDTEIIFARRRKITINDIEVCVPSIEDDLYLVGTHAYNHLRFTLAEILHALNLIGYNKFDWDYLYNLAVDYGTVDAIYAYMKVVNIYSKAFHKCSQVNEDLLDRLSKKTRLCRKIDSWLKNKYLKNMSLPALIPSKIACVYSSFYHSRKLLARASLNEVMHDFLSHYLSLSSKIVLGKT